MQWVKPQRESAESPINMRSHEQVETPLCALAGVYSEALQVPSSRTGDRVQKVLELQK